MAHFRRKHPKDTVGPRNGDWSHPPVEKGTYKFSTVANKRRANNANDVGDDAEYEYDPLDTSQLIVRRDKPKLTRQQRAVKRAQTLASREEWREWWNSHMLWRDKKEVKSTTEELDLGTQPQLIQPKRKRRR